ncbi:MAG: putative transrane protein [Crocinitomicaceae bacterium]|jgi:hypothetical protein|nr:putative transrane protein [Crocinitomicaceae bacterium]
MINKRVRLVSYLVILVALPIFFLFLPASYFDHGQSLCPSKSLLDIECPGCGITRAIQHLIHLDFHAAWEYNKLSFFVLPLFGFLWIREILRVKKSISLNENVKP